MVEWRLTDEKINELQVASIDRLIPRCKAAHFVNVRVRINGEWEEYEADWLKHLARPPDRATRREGCLCSCGTHWDLDNLQAEIEHLRARMHGLIADARHLISRQPCRCLDLGDGDYAECGRCLFLRNSASTADMSKVAP